MTLIYDIVLFNIHAALSVINNHGSNNVLLLAQQNTNISLASAALVIICGFR